MRSHTTLAMTGLWALLLPIASLAADEYVVTVAWSGADYPSPIMAAKNAYRGDRWCQAPRSGRACRIEISAEVHVLHETLVIPEGVAVSGAGAGQTMLVARPGVEIAVASEGRASISDLSIVNRQSEGQKTIGLYTSDQQDARTRGHIERVSVHVSGPMENTALHVGEHLVVTDSTLTAIGGTQTQGTFTQSEDYDLTLIRSRVSANGGSIGNGGVIQPGDDIVPIDLRIHDSYVQTEGIGVYFDTEDSVIDIQGSVIEGGEASVMAEDEGDDTRIVDSTLKGPARFARSTSLVLDRVRLEGTLHLEDSHPVIVGSRLSDEAVAIDDASWLGGSGPTAPGGGLQIRNSLVDAPTVISARASGRITFTSSVITGELSLPGDYIATCRKTFGPTARMVNGRCEL